MAHQVDRRQFLRTFGIGAAVLLGAACAPAALPAPTKPAEAPKPDAKPAAQPPATSAPAAKPAETKPADAPKPVAPAASPATQAAPAAKPAVQGDRLVVAVGQWGTETALPWRSSQSEKPLWDCVYDPLIMRNPQTYQWVPGLATEWAQSNGYKTWTFKLRQGVKFHGDYGELTSEDVKFTVEQNLKPEATSSSTPFFKSQLDRIETPDKSTVVMHFKSAVWEVPTHFVQFNGVTNTTSKKYVESVGEAKAAQSPIGTGPFRYVEGRQGDFHRFEAVQNHWRQTPGFKELVIRRVPDVATRLAGVRSGELDIGGVFGDYLDQARKASLKIHEVKDSAQYWVILSGQVPPGKDDHCPQCPWVGAPDDPKSQDNAKKVRQAMNLAVNKQAIIDSLWKGVGAQSPFMYWFFPFNKGFSAEWKVPPYDPNRARQLLAEAGYPNGFEIRVNPMVFPFAVDAPDVMEAVALDWEKVGIKSRRVPEDWGNFITKVRARKTAQTAWVYGAPPFDEPGLNWQRAIWSKGAFEMVAENDPYDKLIEAILAELDPEKRAKLHNELGQKLYDDYRGVMLGVKSTTWALSKKVGSWSTLAYVPLENNYEYITPA